MIRKDRVFELDDKLKNELTDFTIESLNMSPSENEINISSVRKKRNVHVTDIRSKNKNIEIEKKDRISELDDEQRHCKRKSQEEIAIIVENKVKKRKKSFVVEPKKKSNSNQNNDSISKVNGSIHSKNTSSLLNYFSKSTPQELESKRLKDTQITIKAEIHNSQSLQTSDLLDNKQRKNVKSKDLSSKKIIEKYDEILLVQSETIVLSPNSSNERKNDFSVQQSKPKWSLKVQLQSNGVKIPDIDDEISMSTTLSAPLKENVKNYIDIPKILLPIKDKKIGRNKSPLLVDDYTKKKSKRLNTSVKSMKTESGKNKPVQIKKSESNHNLQIKQNNDYSSAREIESSCIIFDEQDISNNTSVEKLAPLFLKKIKHNAEIIVAKHLFLQSESNQPTDSNEKKNIAPIVQQILPFPKISHINQITSEMNEIVTSNYKTYNFNEKKKFEPSFNYSSLKTILKLNTHNWFASQVYEPIKTDIDLVLDELKTHYSDVESLWKTILKRSNTKNFKGRHTKVKQKKLSTHLNNTQQNNCQWTDKYKPNNSSEMIGNESAVSKLKIWLENWQSLKTNETYSSSEEFYISDSSSSSDINSNKVAVLIGPHGSGKTASVYAVAQELGYMIIEVNASSKRPGKKILKELEEATKSHRVKNFDLENLFAGSSCKIAEADQVSKNSLIFIEDIDLIFEEDDGFISATFQLASNTKRPIVMSLSNACTHLPKMAPHQLQINFKPIVGKKVAVLLQLIAMAETGYQLAQNIIDELCQYGDLRKSLLRLQYLLISGSKHILYTSMHMNDFSWLSMKTCIYKPAIKADRIKRNEQFQTHRAINSLAENLDNFCSVSNLINIKDPTCISINIKYEPCTSLIQSALPFNSLDGVSLEIGNCLNNLVNSAVSSYCKEKTKDTHDVNEIFFKKPLEEQHIILVNSILSKIPSCSSDHQSVNIEYLPCIRNICRAEQVRNQINTKRGNRFFHYLQSSIFSTESIKTSNIFSMACKMLQE